MNINGSKIALSTTDLKPDTIVRVNGVDGRFGDLTPKQQQQILDRVAEVKALPNIPMPTGAGADTMTFSVNPGPGGKTTTFNVAPVVVTGPGSKTLTFTLPPIVTHGAAAPTITFSGKGTVSTTVSGPK